MKNGKRIDLGDGKLASGSTVTENFAVWILGPEIPVTIIVNDSAGVVEVGEKERRKELLESIERLRLWGAGVFEESPC